MAREPTRQRDLAKELRRVGPWAAGALLVALLAWSLPAPVEETGGPRTADAGEGPAVGAPAAAAAPGAIPVNLNAVPWARIECDGNDLGVTPLGAVPLAPGSHDCRARFADGTTERRVVAVGEGSRFVAFGRGAGG